MMDARTKAVKSHRRRLRKRGFKRVEVQVPASEVAVIRKAAEILRNPTTDAAHLRRHLGFETASGQALTALDIFAMPETLSAAGEKLWGKAMKQIEQDRKRSSAQSPARR